MVSADDDGQAKVQVSVRVNAADLAELERIGTAMKPVAVSRNAMVGLAIREYLDRAAAAGKRRPGGKAKADAE